MFQVENLKNDTPNSRIQILAVAKVIPSWMRFTNRARKYQPRALGSSRPGNTLSTTRKIIVVTATRMLGKVIIPTII